MEKLKTIEIDLDLYKIILRFHGGDAPLIVYFDTPSRRFYFSVIALIINEMKKLGEQRFIHIHKFKKELKLLDDSISGMHASKHMDGMLGKIRKAWRDRLPDLETAELFKIPDRDLIPPYEKGGKYRYDCSDVECDTWASLFTYDDNNKWRFRFACDAVSMGLNGVSITLGELKDDLAWDEFVKRLRIETKPDNKQNNATPIPWKKVSFVLIGVLIAFSATLAIWYFYPRATPPKATFELPDKPSIAVLPFSNFSEDPEQEYFADGIVEEIITALSSIPNLFVIARNSTFTYKGKPVKVQQVSAELGVRYVLEGSVRKAEDQVRITAQLIDALSGHHLWANRYDRDLSDIFAVQDEITKNVITALQVKLTEGEQIRSAAKGTNNLEAYLKYLRGKAIFYQFTIEGNALANQLAQESIALDPEYAAAYRLLGAAIRTDIWLGTSKDHDETMKKSMALFQKAIDLDATDSMAFSNLAFSFSMLGKHAKAIETAEHAVALNPNSAVAHAILAHALRFAGRSAEAIPVYQKAIRFNPIPPTFYFFGLGLAYCYTGQYDEAIRWCEKAIQRAPDAYLPHLIAAGVYSMAGREEDARAEVAEVLRIDPNFSLEEHNKRFQSENKQLLIEALQKAGLK